MVQIKVNNMKVNVIVLLVLVVKYSSGAPQSDDVSENEIDADLDVIDLSHMGASIYGVPKLEAGKILDEWDPETDGEFYLIKCYWDSVVITMIAKKISVVY